MFRKKKIDENELFQSLQKLITRDGAVMNLGQLLAQSAQLYGDRIALICLGKRVSFKELYFRAYALTKKLHAKGVKPRDRVLLFFENSIEFYIGYFAIAQAGAVVAPLNTFLREKELEHIIRDAHPRLMIASKELIARLAEDHIENLPELLTEDDMAMNDVVQEHTIEVPPSYLQPDEMAALLYTSGTTGLPKGVMLSARNIMVNCIEGITRLGIGLVKDERAFGVLPLFHSFAQTACVWGSILMGATVIVVPKIERRYIMEGLTHKPTVFLGVPALFGLMCLLKTADLSSVKYFISGGDALPDRIRAAFALVYQRKICTGYGLSETSPTISAYMEDETVVTTCVGRPIVGVTVEIRDEAGAVLEPGTIGEIWVTGQNIMLGYYNEPEKTKEVIKNGWLDTGDLGYIDDKGRLIITGRLKDVIVNKGFKIYPQEIENVLLMYPGVIRVGVIGEIDPMSGEIAVAYVQLRHMEPDIEQKLKNLCTQNLASYKIPRKFICVTHNLPTTATGKVDKKVLRKKGAETKI